MEHRSMLHASTFNEGILCFYFLSEQVIHLFAQLCTAMLHIIRIEL